MEFGRKDVNKKSSNSNHKKNEIRDKSEEDMILRDKALSFSNILRNRRKELGLTQKELADRIGRGRTYVNRIEKGETDLQLSSLLRISSALGLTLKFEMENNG